MFNNKKIKLKAAKKTNIEALKKLSKLQKNNEIIDPNKFEQYVKDLYKKNLKELSKKQK